MSFWSKIKRAFGFSAADDDEVLQDASEQPADECAEPCHGSETEPVPEPEPVELDEDVRRRIFDHVVEVFNGAMPQFIRDSVDPNAQTDYIYRTLDESVKEYFDAMDRRIHRQCEREYQERNNRLSAELARLQQQTRTLEDERSAMRERQLSADRQRRAVTDRVHDLEQKLAALDAECEQLRLENRSLINRLKVLQVKAGDEAGNTEAETADIAGQTPTDQPADTVTEAAKTDGDEGLQASAERCAQLETRLAELTGELDETRERAAKISGKLDRAIDERDTARKAVKKLEEVNAELAAQVKPLTVDNTKLHEAMRKQADMHRISEAMMGDLRRSAALSREELNNERRRCADLEAQLNATADLREELHQAKARVAELDDVHRQAERLRTVLDEERARIAELERQVQNGDRTEELSARCRELEAELTKVRRRLTQAESLLAEVAAADRQPAAGASVPRISDEALQTVEVNFSDDNWQSRETEASVAREPDPAFEPPKRRGRGRRKKGDDPQLSLF